MTSALSSITSNQDGVAAPRNFARSAQDLAAAGVPGFDAYVKALNNNAPATKAEALPAASDTNKIAPVSFRGVPDGPQMSYEDNDFSLHDVLDVLNPLQHIPLVGSLYRAVTGDNTIKPAEQVVGDIAYGALGSMAVSAIVTLANAMIGGTTGTPADKQVAEALFGTQTPNTEAPAPVVLAQAAPSANPTTPTIPAPLPRQNAVTSKPLPPLSTSAVNQIVAATAAKTTPGKQPFGGVMDMNTGKRLAAINDRSAIQIGNTLHPDLSLNRNAARMQAQFAPRAPMAVPNATATSTTTNASVTPQDANAANNQQTRQIPATAAMTPTASPDALLANTAAPATAAPKAEDLQLGQLMHDSADKVAAAAEKGSTANTLPPELVQDMMLMALDKYKSASQLGAMQ